MQVHEARCPDLHTHQAAFSIWRCARVVSASIPSSVTCKQSNTIVLTHRTPTVAPSTSQQLAIRA
eukprot:scaffold672695_cov59-Prasinocladus_malaysianus.AAC.1